AREKSFRICFRLFLFCTCVSGWMHFQGCCSHGQWELSPPNWVPGSPFPCPCCDPVCASFPCPCPDPVCASFPCLSPDPVCASFPCLCSDPVCASFPCPSPDPVCASFPCPCSDPVCASCTCSELLPLLFSSLLDPGINSLLCQDQQPARVCFSCAPPHS
uniref:Uncharacterized protein n=1 Tax=Junco hyemalis TaxID=40217 RepID=A0A8C5IG93_JUNHY